MVKRIIHQISLSEIGGVQRSFSLYLAHALEKSDFNHFVCSMRDFIAMTDLQRSQSIFKQKFDKAAYRGEDK